jgi:membrane protein YqaA with SNARE-associated domain
LDKTANPPLGDAHLTRHISIGRWFLFYAAFFLAVAVPLGFLVAEQPGPFGRMLVATGHIFAAIPKAFYAFWTFLRELKLGGWDFQLAFAEISPLSKLLFMTLYLTLCTTFIPLPTGFMVSLMATRAAGIGCDLGTTMLVLAAVGGVASTIGNMNDYHVFMLLLRSGKVARLRDTKAYLVGAKWFAKSPFTIMVIFNIIHIPIDVPRMLAAIYGYPRKLFAASNFIGRFSRYALFALITRMFGPSSDWIAPLIFLGTGFLIAMWKLLPALLQKLRLRRTNLAPAGVSNPQNPSQEKET